MDEKKWKSNKIWKRRLSILKWFSAGSVVEGAATLIRFTQGNTLDTIPRMIMWILLFVGAAVYLWAIDKGEKHE